MISNDLQQNTEKKNTHTHTHKAKHGMVYMNSLVIKWRSSLAPNTGL